MPFDNLESRPDVTLIPPRDFETASFRFGAAATHPGGAFTHQERRDLCGDGSRFGPGADRAPPFSRDAAARDSTLITPTSPAHKGWDTGAGRVRRHRKDQPCRTAMAVPPQARHTDEAARSPRASEIFPSTSAASEGTPSVSDVEDHPSDRRGFRRCSAVVVLGLDLMFARRGTAVNPSNLEMQTYDGGCLRRRSRDGKTSCSSRSTVARPKYGAVLTMALAALFHASLLDFLTRGQPTVIAYDVNFASPDRTLLFDLAGTKWTGAESDEELVKSARKAGNVIAIADATYEVDAAAHASLDAGNPVIPDQGFQLDAAEIVERQLVFLPYPGLRDNVAGYGHNLAILDPDGALRHMTPFVRSNHRARCPSGRRR